MTRDEIIKAYLTADFLNFTRLMFKHKRKSDFVVAPHHELIAKELMKVITGETKNLIINIAPRYGKTELISVNFPAYGYALNPRCNFIETSYSKDLTENNSTSVKEIMKSEAYQKYFSTRIQDGNDTKSEWGTEQGGKFFATSTLGQLTGFGAGSTTEYKDGQYTFSGAIIIDDPIKPLDALSDTKRKAVNDWFYNTLKSRTNNPKTTPIIIIMQRLHIDDLCGHIIANDNNNEWRVVSIPCLTTDEDGNEKALWDFKHDVNALHQLRADNSFVFETQYQQNPTPIEGLMYTNLRTYETIPIENYHKVVRKCYIDTADTGADYLCAICYEEHPTAMYITDVLYTNKPMEYTEPETAKMLVKNNVQIVNVESNNGGRGFARNVEQQVRLLGNRKMMFHNFTQTQNKQVRIFSHSAEVQNMVYFPANWETTFARFATDVKGYLKEGRNAHDDSVDALSGLTEFFGTNGQLVTEEDIFEDFL